MCSKFKCNYSLIADYFGDGLINHLFAAAPLLSQECRYLLIIPFQNVNLMTEGAL